MKETAILVEVVILVEDTNLVEVVILETVVLHYLVIVVGATTKEIMALIHPTANMLSMSTILEA